MDVPNKCKLIDLNVNDISNIDVLCAVICNRHSTIESYSQGFVIISGGNEANQQG
jgi:hypothetical protein